MKYVAVTVTLPNSSVQAGDVVTVDVTATDNVVGEITVTAEIVVQS